MRYGVYRTAQATAIIRSEDGVVWTPITVGDEAALIARALNAYSDPEQTVEVPDTLDQLAAD